MHMCSCLGLCNCSDVDVLHVSVICVRQLFKMIYIVIILTCICLYRVLCFGGTLVLLLSPQLSCLLKKLLAQTDTGSTSNQETEPQTGIQDCSFSLLTSTKQQTFQSSQGVKSSSTQETDCQNGPQRSQPPSLSSLKHQATVRVSLGAIDGLIHKYIKTDI